MLLDALKTADLVLHQSKDGDKAEHITKTKYMISFKKGGNNSF